MTTQDTTPLFPWVKTQLREVNKKQLPAEIQKCAFPDSMVTVSEGGTDLGRFSVTVEFAHRAQEPCLMLHAQSQGAIDGSPCGTTVTAYLNANLEVLEEDYHEYVKVSHCQCISVNMCMQEVTKESVSYPKSTLSGLVTEGSILLLMRLIALKKKVPAHMRFISFDQGLHIIHTTFLGLKQMDVGGKTVEVFGIERIVHSVDESPTTWQCYFLDDGHLASRVQLGSPITMRLLQLPSQIEKVMGFVSLMIGFEKVPLVWEEDMQMQSNFLDRKEELRADHASYLRHHPEIRALISDFLQLLLLRKPDDVFQFARDYFLPFASPRPPGSSLKASLS
uniref:Ciliogenesis-associated TTC17-interacting protein n=1 Tax=Echeneis naucrates TaxID=173247 RepID=A0A665U1T5_ECHNA